MRLCPTGAKNVRTKYADCLPRTEILFRNDRGEGFDERVGPFGVMYGVEGKVPKDCFINRMPFPEAKKSRVDLLEPLCTNSFQMSPDSAKPVEKENLLGE